MRSKIQDVKRGKPAKMVKGVTHTEYRKSLQQAAADARFEISSAKESVKQTKVGVREGKLTKRDLATAERWVVKATNEYAKAVTKRDEWTAKNKRVK